MSSRLPILLRLVPGLPLTGLGLLRALGRQHPGCDGGALRGRFLLSSRERVFVRELQRRKTNLAIWRCHQGEACGDFAVLDMSRTRPELRVPLVVELKMGGALKLGGRPHQLRHARRAAERLEGRGLVDGSRPEQVLVGDRDAVLSWLGA